MKKTISLLIVALMIFGVGVNAQDLGDVEIVSGAVEDISLTTEDISSTNEIGGLVVEILNIFERYLEMDGVKVWKDRDETNVDEYQLLAFETGTNPEFNELILGDVFEISEEVEIGGVTDIWTTYNISSMLEGKDFQTPTGVNIPNYFDDETSVELLSYNGINEFSYRVNGNTFYKSCVAIEDPKAIDLGFESYQDLEDALEEVYGNELEWARIGYISELDNAFVILTTDSNTDEILMFVDKDKDGKLCFEEPLNGFSSDAISGQTLMILPEGYYDIYGIIE